MKRFFTTLIIICISLPLCFSQELQKKFVKGNISDKTTAVREGTGEEGLWLSNHAIDFIIDNAKLMEGDRDFEALAVAAILSLPNAYGSGKTESEKNAIAQKFLTIYNDFEKSSTVQIAVLSKYLVLRNYLPCDPLTQRLNTFMASPESSYADPSLLKTVINTLSFIGNNESFSILYKCYTDSHYGNFKEEIEDTLLSLIPVSMNEIIAIIHTKDIKQVSRIYGLITRNNNISLNFISEIAENLLNETILIAGNSMNKNEIITVQLGSLKILNDNKCTRASASVLSFFNTAKKEFNEGYITEDQFIEVISSTGNLAPIDSVTYLISYLEELNHMVEKEREVSYPVVIAVIDTLGAIGDKTAFDSLLAVTYIEYPESVLSSARNALAGLKW